MIIRENIIEVEDSSKEFMLICETIKVNPSEIIFFDLEHYVYKKPKCIGVFGACIYNNSDKKLHVTQYMLENKDEVIDILVMAKKYFSFMKKRGKKAIMTFSGNNDFTVINYLFQKYNIEYDFSKEFKSIDIQKEYERIIGNSIGLKNLEKVFNINRQGELLSGSNLAKTFHKVMKDRDYIKRIPKHKIKNILLYNEQDVVNLYEIFLKWSKYINEEYKSSLEEKAMLTEEEKQENKEEILKTEK